MERSARSPWRSWPTERAAWGMNWWGSGFETDGPLGPIRFMPLVRSGSRTGLHLKIPSKERAPK